MDSSRIELQRIFVLAILLFGVFSMLIGDLLGINAETTTTLMLFAWVMIVLIINPAIKLPVVVYIYGLVICCYSSVYYLNKGDLDYFGFIKFINFGICFYVLFLFGSFDEKWLIRVTRIVHLVILYVFALEAALLLSLVLPEGIRSLSFVPELAEPPMSRWLNLVVGTNFMSPLGLAYSAQGGAHLLLFSLLLFGAFQETKLFHSRWAFWLAVVLLFLTSNHTVGLIFLFYLTYLGFRSGRLMLIFPVLAAAITLFTLAPLFRGALLEYYIGLWVTNLLDILSYPEFYQFGFSSNVPVEGILSTWELGLVQILFHAGIMPVLVWLACLLFLIYLRSVSLKKLEEPLVKESIGASRLEFIRWSLNFSVPLVILCLATTGHYLSLMYTPISILLAFYVAVFVRCAKEVEEAAGQNVRAK